MDMLKSACFSFLFLAFVIFSRSHLCDSRHLGDMDKKLSMNHDHLTTKNNNEDITKLEAPSTNKTRTLSSQSHAVVNCQLNGRRTKESRRVKPASLDRKTAPSKKATRTWKVPKDSKKQPKSDQGQPGFNLDYMQPSTHPPHHN